MSDTVSIKGTSDGVAVSIGSGHWADILIELAEKLNQRASFFKGGRVLLAVQDRQLNQKDVEAVGQVLSEHQMTLWAIEGDDSETYKTAQTLGLEIQHKAPPKRPTSPAATLDNTTQVIHRTIRSGQSIEYPGHLVILGDINPGAKVTAGGHIIVWGRVQGTVHAGAIDSENGFVCALKLKPTQLIIGKIIARSPTDGDSNRVAPERAFVQDGNIVAEAWP